MNQSRVPRRWYTEGEQEWNTNGTGEGIKKFTRWNNGAEESDEGNQGEAEIPNFGLWDRVKRVGEWSTHSSLWMKRLATKRWVVICGSPGRKVEFAGWIGKGSARLVTRI